jgi:hypothetical protein
MDGQHSTPAADVAQHHLELELKAQLGDVKLLLYHQSLLLSALLDLLVAKGLIRREEIASFAMGIDRDLATEDEKVQYARDKEENGES